ncbi:hypothetical protein [Streptomyces sp. NPDC059874]|uniref:hypothetical protein n=1 Tax=Streptomyces sp. NPDC059874 TaxID=3346983 RepID=UPI00364FC0CC
MRYLKVEIEGKYIGTDSTLYSPLDEGADYSEEELVAMAQDMVNQEYAWGHEVVEEGQVPAGERQ